MVVDEQALAALLGRLYARLRARGGDQQEARRTAAQMGAEMLGCDVAVARQVLDSSMPVGRQVPPPVTRKESSPMGFQFVTATKHGSKARIALNGTAGAGKTWSALSIAEGLDRGDQSLGLIDTDRGSARKYADRFAFQWLGMSSYNPDDLVRATIAAAEQNIGTLIVDTASAFWSGADGMLDRVGQSSSNFEGWRNMRPVERRMMDALFGYPGHVIVTMRTKAEYVVESNDSGKMAPRRVGTKPDQRDGIEHEFDVVLDMADAGEHARVVKTRCPELANRAFSRPGAQVGEIVQAWLERDAVGEPLNPLRIASWALDTEDLGALKERYDALGDAGQLAAVVYDRDGESLVGIGELVLARARELRKAVEVAARAQQRQQQAAP